MRHIQAVLRTMLNAAIEDGVIASNPAAKLGRTLKLNVSRATTQEEIKAMTQSQRHLFLATALRVAPRYYPLFFVLAGTGMRLARHWPFSRKTPTIQGRRSASSAPFQRMAPLRPQNQATGARSISPMPSLTPYGLMTGHESRMSSSMDGRRCRRGCS